MCYRSGRHLKQVQTLLQYWDEYTNIWKEKIDVTDASFSCALPPNYKQPLSGHTWKLHSLCKAKVKAGNAETDGRHLSLHYPPAHTGAKTRHTYTLSDLICLSSALHQADHVSNRTGKVPPRRWDIAVVNDRYTRAQGKLVSSGED